MTQISESTPSKPNLDGKPDLQEVDDGQIKFKFKFIKLPQPEHSDRGLEPSQIEKLILDPVIENVLKRKDIQAVLAGDPIPESQMKPGDTTWLQVVPIQFLDSSTRTTKTSQKTRLSFVKKLFSRPVEEPVEEPIKSKLGNWGSKDHAVVIHFAIAATNDTEDSSQPKQEHGWALFVMSGKDTNKFAADCLKDPSAVFEHLVDLGMLSEDEPLQLSTGEQAEVDMGEHVIILSNTHVKGRYPKNYASTTTVK